jgi:hypothetical protein
VRDKKQKLCDLQKYKNKNLKEENKLIDPLKV